MTAPTYIQGVRRSVTAAVTGPVTAFVTERKRSGRPRSRPDQKPDPTEIDPAGKICLRCMRPLALKSFSKNRGKIDGLAEHCKRCMRDYQDSRRDLNRVNSALYGRKLRAAALDHYGRACACCNEPHEEFLAIDHIDGNGNEQRKETGSGTAFYSWLAKNGYPIGFRTLCHNCNLAIGFYGYCPHPNSVVLKSPHSSF